ncbi:MAG: ABC transporter transmembrane domain-containing protein [Sphingomonadales bacterium]
MIDENEQAPKGNDSQPEKGTFKKLGSLKMIFGFMAKYKGLMTGALIALLISSGAILTIFRSLEFMVEGGFGAEKASEVQPYFIIGFFLIGILAVSTFFRFLFISILGERVVADIRKKVHEHLLGLSPAFFESNRPSEIASRLTADTTLIQTVVGSSLSIALRSIINVLGSTILILLMAPAKIISILGILFVIMGPVLFFGKKIQKLSRSSQDKIAGVGTMANEAFGAIQVVQAFTREKEEKSRFGSAVEAAFDVAKKRIRARAWMMAMVIGLVFGFINFGLWSGAEAVVDGNLTADEIGKFVTFMGLSLVLATSFGGLSEVISELQRASGAAGRLTDLLSTIPDLPVALHPQPLPNPSKGNVEFRNVSFFYPSKPDIMALNDFSLSANSGETVAIVGPSGAGKSTTLQLLLRFFDPQQGGILIDGYNLLDVDPVDLRSKMSFVPQDTIIFAETIEANIRFGRPDATVDEVKGALDASLCTEFIHDLPRGMKTYLGERGVRLSGGQRQRLSIARAILRDAPILLLDEATSALDSEAEVKVQKALDELMKGRTTLVIAHRLSTVRKADKIIVMEEGAIVAQGTHDVLVKNGGLYARLANLQFNEAEE